METNGTKKETDIPSDPDPDTICGFGGFHPGWLQRLATPRIYLALYSILGTLSGAYYTYRIGVITTLEKRFAFNSKVSGLIMMVDEVTPIFVGVPVGHWASRTHRPRLIGLGMFTTALCCFISAVPYIAYGPETRLSGISGVPKNESKLDMCGPLVQDCDVDDRPPKMPVVLLLIVAAFLKGFGTIAYDAIGLAYMDDIAKKKNSPLYLATTLALRLLGPILGYLMSSAFLKYYENPYDDPGYGPEDPRWIGGWWIGFLLQGFLLLVFSGLIALFPRRLPGQPKPDLDKKDGIHMNFNFRELLVSIKRLSTNPIYMLIVIRTVLAIGTLAEYMMLPKYMEHQFKMTASDASLYSGPPGLIALMSSMLIGGFLMWRFRPGPRVLTAILFILEILPAIATLILMIFSCETVQMAHYGLNDKGFIMEAECNMNCNCSTSAFTPVCGSDGVTVYFSPCHAGCTQTDGQTFSNCSCVWGADGSPSGNVTTGFCDEKETCWSQALAYIITLPTIQFISSLFSVGYTMLIFRAIHPSDKSIAIGYLETFMCLFGFLPFLSVFSSLVDSACLVWEESCGETGNCWFYDVPKFNYMLHGISASFSTLSALCLLALCFLSGRIGNLYEDDPLPDTQNCEEEKTLSYPLKEL